MTIDIGACYINFRAAGVVPPAEGESHQCEHCKCHVPEKDIDVSYWRIMAITIGQDK